MSIPEMVKLTPCHDDSALVQALTELKTTKTADVTLRNNFVTVVNRRMFKEHKEREITRLRVKRFRSNGVVTQKCALDTDPDPDPKRLNDANRSLQSKSPNSVNRSSLNRSHERELMNRLRNALGDLEMAQSGGHWLTNHVRKNPHAVDAGLNELKTITKEKGLRTNPAAWLTDYLKRFK